MNIDLTKKPEDVSAQDLAILGGGTLSYIKEIGATDAIKLLGPKINVPDDAKLFCLYAADGTPMSISGTREAAIANAMEHELLTVSVH
jgi:hypothetical protein